MTVEARIFVFAFDERVMPEKTIEKFIEVCGFSVA